MGLLTQDQGTFMVGKGSLPHQTVQSDPGPKPVRENPWLISDVEYMGEPRAAGKWVPLPGSCQADSAGPALWPTVQQRHQKMGPLSLAKLSLAFLRTARKSATSQTHFSCSCVLRVDLQLPK